jgi:hypothetical protein
MSKTIEYKIKVDSGDSVKSLGQLEQELAQINEELREVAPGSEAFDDLTKSAQGLTKEIGSINRQIEGITGEDKIRGLDGAIKTLAGSTQATVGALGLLGIESEKFGEFEEKAASAIAFGIGLKDVGEGVTQLAGFITKLPGPTKIATIAQKAFNVALRANPIGLVVTAIGLLVGGLVLFNDKIQNAIRSIEPLNIALEKAVNFFRSIGQAIGIVASEEEELAQKTKELTEQRIKDIDNELKVRKSAGKDTTNLEREKYQKLLELTEEGSQEQKDALADLEAFESATRKRAKDDAIKTEEEKQKELLDLILFEEEARKFAAERFKEIGEDNAREYARGVVEGFDKIKKEEPLELEFITFIDPEDLEIEEDVAKVVQNFQDSLQGAIDNTIARKDTWDNFISTANSAFNAVTELSEANFQVRLRQLERERSAVETNAQLTEEQRTAALERIAQKERQEEIRRIKAERDQFTLKQTLVAAESILKTNLFVQEQVQLAKLSVAKGVATSKQLAIDGAAATAKAGMSLGAFVATLGPFGLIAYAASIVGIIATIVSARKKANAQIAALSGVSGASGGGGGGVPTVNATIPRQPEQQSPMQSNLEVGNALQREQRDGQPLYTYVVEGDVRSAQEAQAKIRARRTIAD